MLSLRASNSPGSFCSELNSAGASWADSCGYWGGLHGYTTAPFDPAAPPTRLKIDVADGTRYSFVLYAVPAAG